MKKTFDAVAWMRKRREEIDKLVLTFVDQDHFTPGVDMERKGKREHRSHSL